MKTPAISLEDKYRLEHGRVFLTGVQALTRLPMLQRTRDRAAGLNTAGYVSGYRGSPLGGLDHALVEAKAFLDAHDVRFHPGVNEELAATAIWGTQQLHLLPGGKRDGIFAMWYGKGPGVDRCGDVFKHANYAGTSAAGGVLVVAGDDHAARSSAVAHQSEHTFSACAMPVLAPAGVQDILDFGLHGWAMSRYTGCWVAMKLAADIVESSATVDVDLDRVQVLRPTDFELPPDGLHIRWPDPQVAQELRMQAYKIYAAAAYVRANRLDRLLWDSPRARLGLIACGKAWADLRQAMDDLGIDERTAAALGLRVYKVAMPWPLEAEGVRRFATGLEEILVVEEKRQIIEYQLKEMLYNWREDVRPRVLGKFDEAGEWPMPHSAWLLPPAGELTPDKVARALAQRLARIDPTGRWIERAATFGPFEVPNAPIQRLPYFCSGCPHNRSTRVPEGSHALAGVGCHLMAVTMERDTLTISQMGGEGATWIGMAEHAGVHHVFANMGDGTYFHSGLLAIRAAVAAGVNITYKLLFNDAVAMTGGQPIDGPLTVPQLTRQLAAEGVARIVVVADDPEKYPDDAGFAPGIEPQPRERIDDAMRELRDAPGVSVLVYDQVCATEARRRRKRGTMASAGRHVFINEAVCDGCGDCAQKSNCLSVVPVQTEFGPKRMIDQFTCNQDLSCLEGRCPALVTVEGAVPRRGHGLPVPPGELPEPVLPLLDEPYSMLIAGVGGTGVVTVGAIVAMAAHLEGKGVTVLDQTGLAQKGGAVLTHVRIGAAPAEMHAPRIVRADLLLGCDLLVAASSEALGRARADRTRAVVNLAEAITGEFVRHPEKVFPGAATLDVVRRSVARCDSFDASGLATRLAGHSIATNMLMLGIAWQRGWVPVGREALAQAIELNGVAAEDNRRAFEWGRRVAADPALAAPPPVHTPHTQSLATLIEHRAQALRAYQGDALAERYLTLIERVRAAEQAAAAGSERLSRAVAIQAQRLLSPKDEYEVARLHLAAEFDAALDATFEGRRRVSRHFALPWQRADGPDGVRKRAFGPWIRPALRLLALGRHVRGTRFDPLRHGKERRLDREVWREYEQSIEHILGRLDAAHLDAAVALAEAVATVRGYGPVRQGHAEAWRTRQRALLQRFDDAAGADGDRAAASAAAPAAAAAQV